MFIPMHVGPTSITKIIAISLFFLSLSFCQVSSETALQLSLEASIHEAIRQNPRLDALKQRIKAQQERFKATSLDKWAKFEASYRYTWLDQPPYVKFRDFPLENRIPFGKDRDVLWSIEFMQPIFTGFAISTKEALERLGVDLREVEYEIGRIDLGFYVKQAYLMVLMARGEVRVAKEQVKALKSHLKDAKAMFKQGLIAKNDLLRSEVAFKGALQELERAQGALKTKKAYLKTLLNIQANTPIVLTDVREPDLTFDKSFDQLKAIAQGHRPEIKALMVSIERAHLYKRLAKSNYFPNVYLLGRYEQSGDDLLANRNDFKNSHNTIIAVEATWRFFEWGKTRHEIQESTYKINELEKQLEDLKNNISFQIKEALHLLLVAKRNIATANTALEQAQEDLRLTKLQYKERLASTSDVLDAQHYLTQARQNLLSAKYGYLLAISKLERAIGQDLYEY